jgi:uncharacterized protein
MKTISVLVLFFLTSLSGSAQTLENIPLLTVTGEAVVKVIPDQAVISVRVQRRVDIANISAVSDAFLFSKENTDIKFLGSDNREVLSTVLEAKIDGKAALFIKEFIITVKNLSDLTKVIMELLRHDFTDIYSISYRVTNLNEVKNTARKDAIANARATAVLLARELGVTIGKAHLVKEEEILVNNWYIEKYRPDIRELTNTTYFSNPGFITVPSKVTVSFNLQ